MNIDPGVRVIRQSAATGLSNRAGVIIFPPMAIREKLLKRGLVETVDREPVTKVKLVVRK